MEERVLHCDITTVCPVSKQRSPMEAFQAVCGRETPVEGTHGFQPDQNNLYSPLQERENPPKRMIGLTGIQSEFMSNICQIKDVS